MFVFLASWSLLCGTERRAHTHPARYALTSPFSSTCHNWPLSTSNAVSQPPLQQLGVEALQVAEI